MKLIKPAEISAKIMSLIDDSEKELIIISPYNKIGGWAKLINRIKKAQAREIKISWYSRKNNVDDNNAKEVILNLGIRPVLIDDLHAKIYMNEKSAVFTSMNMSKISDDKSIDLGYITENQKEYDEIFNFFKTFIYKPNNIENIEELTSTNYKKNLIKNEVLGEPISNFFYLAGIHEHLKKQYGTFKYIINQDNGLTYFDFRKPNYSIQFITYDQAIKVLINLPTKTSISRIENKINQNANLIFKRELAYSEYENNVKYYYKSNHKIVEWGKYQLQLFLKDFDILIDLVFKS